MNGKWLLHVMFWVGFSVLYTLVQMAFAPPSDMEYDVVVRFFRYWLMEIAFLPFKAAPFYLLFYVLIPRYFREKKVMKIFLFLSASMFLCVLVIRWITPHISYAMYGDYPTYETFSPGRLLYSLTEIIPAFSLASAIKLIKQWNLNQKKSIQLQQEKTKAELQYLKAQTNPHFLFNTLNNLYGLARRNSEKTATAIMKLSHLFRYILEECREPFIPVSKEIELIKSYIELESLRYNGRLSLETEFNVSDSSTVITPMILLPLIENAFKHGASESTEIAFIHIELTATPEEIHFSVVNSIDKAGKENSSLGLGLQNVRRQLELIYPQKHQIQFSKNDKKFSVVLTIYPEEQYSQIDTGDQYIHKIIPTELKSSKL